MAKMQIVTAAATTHEFTRKGEGDVVELNDGHLLLVYMEFSGDGSDVARTRLAAMESADGGRSWGQHRVVAETAPGDVSVYSPNLIRAQDGRVLMVMRSQLGALFLSESSDDGAMWSLPQTSGLRSPESCPDLGTGAGY